MAASDITALIHAATAARDRAYAVYSNHPVGAALLADDGQIYAGCNVENAAYPLGNCAEPAAIAAMVLAGGRNIAHLVVAGPGQVACTPCGGCRQRIHEFGAPDTRITMCDVDGNIVLETTLGDVLPHAFGGANVTGTKTYD